MIRARGWAAVVAALTTATTVATVAMMAGASGAGAASVAGPAGLARVAAAPYTAFVLDSENDFVGFDQQLTFSPANSTITSTKSQTQGLVSLTVTAPGHEFTAVLAPPGALPLLVSGASFSRYCLR